MAASPEVVAQALAQVEQGFAVFALGVNSKRPVTMHGFKDATTDVERVAAQLNLPVAGNYGITWPAEREPVVVLDLDNGEDGRERPWQDRLLEQIDRIGPLPSTKSTTTPSGGRHAFYRWPAGVAVPAGDELFGFTARWPGRGYLVGPGSSIDGVAYLPGPVPDIVELPSDWVAAAVAGQRHGGVRDGVITVSGGRFEVPARVTSGQRYATIRDYVASRYNSGLGVDELWELVRSQVAPHFTQPLDETELRDRFDRVVAKIGQRLGPPRFVNQFAIPAGPLEEAPLTDFTSRPIEWVWPAWLPRAVVTIMDGNPGVSKSTLVADLVARITVGGSWPDGGPIGQTGRVLWITTEDDPGRVLRPRIEAAGGDASRVRFVTSEVVFPTSAGAFLELLVRLAGEPEGLALVVLDPLFSHIEATVRTIADAEMRRGVMNPLREAAEAANTAVIVVRHFNKDTNAGALNRGAGSLGGIVGAARALWTVLLDPEDEEGSTKVVGVSKSSYAEEPLPLRYQVVSLTPPGWVTGSVSGIEWAGAAEMSIHRIMAAPADAGDAWQRLAELLQDGPQPATAVRNRMRATGYGRRATDTAKARLGVVTSKEGMTGGWMWSLPDPEGAEDAHPHTFEGVEDAPRTSSAPSRAGAGAGTARPRTSSSSSKVPKMHVPGSPPRARAREGGSDEPTQLRPAPVDSMGWVHPCRDYANHRDQHRQTDAGWTCDACYGQGASA